MKPLHYLQRMTYPQVRSLAARTDLALLPVGPPEAHGPHLPVGTDLIAAGELCERAAWELAARGTECLIAPLLPYCLAEVASLFPGTITVRAAVVAALVADICQGLAHSGFGRTLIVSGHAEGENLAALRDGAGQAGETGALVEVSRWYEGALPGLLYLLKEEHPEHDIHAGEWETALVLLRAPELVDQTASRPSLQTGRPGISPNGEPPGLGLFQNWERRKPTAEILAGQPLRLPKASTPHSESLSPKREYYYLGSELFSRRKMKFTSYSDQSSTRSRFSFGCYEVPGPSARIWALARPKERLAAARV